MRRSLLCIALFTTMWSCGGGDVTILGEGSYHLGAGSSRLFLLPGGGRVKLSPQTSITLAKGYGKDNRDIMVDGEAFFDLNGGPFKVLTRDLNIVVLTAARFRVEASRSRPGEEVDLLEGRIKASKAFHSDTDNEPEVLDAGDMVMVNRDIDLIEKEKLSPEDLARLRAKW